MIKLISALMVYAEMEMMRRKERMHINAMSEAQKWRVEIVLIISALQGVNFLSTRS